jgi:hypothetical protein
MRGLARSLNFTETPDPEDPLLVRMLLDLTSSNHAA